MKNSVSILLVFLIIIPLSAQKVSEIQKTYFSDEVLTEKVTDIQGKELTIKNVLAKHKGKVIVLEFWAAWCSDCLVGMPAAHKLRENNPQVQFIYFSLERSKELWLKGLGKYDLGAGDNYWFSQGWRNPFNNYIELNWIPRYMVLDKKGEIAKYYAVAADDPEIQKTIDSFKK